MAMQKKWPVCTKGWISKKITELIGYQFDTVDLQVFVYVEPNSKVTEIGRNTWRFPCNEGISPAAQQRSEQSLPKILV